LAKVIRFHHIGDPRVLQREPDSVAIWDTRSTQHDMVMDCWPAPRKMERAGISIDKYY
jgi:alpha-ketoglutarate-dependent taurine dioxygenase